MKGSTIINTRAADDAEPLTSLLEARGARVLHAPMVRFVAPSEEEAVALRNAVAHLRDFSVVVFTSPRAVACVEPPPGASYNAVALGRRTHAAAQAAGWRVLNPENLADASALTTWMAGHVPLRGARVLWPTSNLAAPAVAPLKRAGAAVTVAVGYHTAQATHVPDEVLSALRLNRVQAKTVQADIAQANTAQAHTVRAVVCMSPSAVEAWCALVPASLHAGLLHVAPGAATASAWKRAGFDANVTSTTAEPAAVVAALEKALDASASSAS